VGEVYSGGVAEEAGLRGGEESVMIGNQQMILGGDVITAWNGESVATVRDLRARLAETNTGESVELTVLRDGEPLTLTLEF
jgi:S1-C subfamily serine protease